MRGAAAVVAVVVTQLTGCLCDDLEQTTKPGPGVTIQAPPGKPTYEGHPIIDADQPATFSIVGEGLGSGKSCPQIVKWSFIDYVDATPQDQVVRGQIPTHRAGDGSCVLGDASTP